MYVLITLLLLVFVVATIGTLRLSRRLSFYAWLAAALGSLTAWISIFFWQLDMPRRFTPSVWVPVTLFSASPELFADSVAWLYALGLVALTGAVILTSPARTSTVPIRENWAGILALAVLALLAVLANSPLTLVLVWTAIDFTELFNTLRGSDSAALSERAVVSFGIRAAGTGFALWASVTNAVAGNPFLFENTSTQTGIFLLIGAGLRLGVLPLHLAFRSEPTLHRGFGSALRLTTAATSLILLARLPASALDAAAKPFLLGFVVLAALYGGWMWFTASDEINGRPYWIIGMSALALAATLRGSSAGSAAWGGAMLLFGGISFLYSARQVWFTRFLAGLGLLLLGLPFTLTASGWLGAFPWPVLFWPLFIIAHFLLVAGYVRHLFQPGEIAFSELPTWAQSSYPAGLGLLVLTVIVAGLWGWPGALQFGVWIVPSILLPIAGLTGFAMWRFRRFAGSEIFPSSDARSSRLGALQEFFARGLWTIYSNLGRLFGYVANLLEGDGGLLWTLLLLVLIITTLQAR